MTKIRLSGRIVLVSVVLLFVDIFGLCGSFFLAVQSRKLLIPLLGGSVSWLAYLSIFYLGILSVVGMFLFSGLYPGFGLTAVKEIELIVKSQTIVFIFLGIAMYFLKANIDYPRSIFLFSWFYSLVILPVFRVVVRNRFSLSPLYGVPVSFILPSEKDTSVMESVITCRRMGWNPLAVWINNTEPVKDHQLLGIPISPSLDHLIKQGEQNLVSTVIFVSGSFTESNEKDLQLIRKLGDHFQSIVLAFSTFELGSIWAETRDLEGRLGLELNYHLLKPETIFLKRIMDILGVIGLFILTSPFWILLPILIKLDSHGPVLYSHRRVGKNGKEIGVLKFRTMISDADKRLQEYLDSHPDAKREWDEHQKLTDDPRITRVGKWLRKFSLDELPQFWNVLIGDMSLIGPRAVTEEEVKKYGDFSPLILRVKPGITGWWQTTGRNQTTWERRMQLEVYYVSNWSLWMDAYITLKTLWVIVSAQGR